MDMLQLVGRRAPLFDDYMVSRRRELAKLVSNSHFLSSEVLDLLVSLLRVKYLKEFSRTSCCRHQ